MCVRLQRRPFEEDKDDRDVAELGDDGPVTAVLRIPDGIVGIDLQIEVIRQPLQRRALEPGRPCGTGNLCGA
jgi:hypothetical protein